MLVKRKNLVNELLRERKRQISERELMDEVCFILAQDEAQRDAIKQRLGNDDEGRTNVFNIDLLEPDKVFHISHIKAICIDYRLRFLNSHLFKPALPEEAISKIKHLEKMHNITLHGFKIMAPSKSFHLKNYDDPLLFAAIGNGYYYLIHKWGTDLNAWRKLFVRPFRNFGSFLVFLVAVSLILTFALSGQSVNGVSQETFLLLSFLFIFKSVCGMALYYCFWKGKNFNSAIWNSEFYNK